MGFFHNVIFWHLRKRGKKCITWPLKEFEPWTPGWKEWFKPLRPSNMSLNLFFALQQKRSEKAEKPLRHKFSGKKRSRKLKQLEESLSERRCYKFGPYIFFILATLLGQIYQCQIYSLQKNLQSCPTQTYFLWIKIMLPLEPHSSGDDPFKSCFFGIKN